MNARQLALEIKEKLEYNLLTFNRFEWNGNEITMFFTLDDEKFKIKVSKDE